MNISDDYIINRKYVKEFKLIIEDKRRYFNT